MVWASSGATFPETASLTWSRPLPFGVALILFSFTGFERPDAWVPSPQQAVRYRHPSVEFMWQSGTSYAQWGTARVWPLGLGFAS